MIDIIIPIFNAHDDLQRCTASLIRHNNTNCRVILIDDASTDSHINTHCEALALRADPQFLHFKNETNLGFVQTVNRGMSYSRNDVVLLNTDTIVTSHWLEKFERCANSDASIGSITPFSNNAEICSFPVFCVNNSLQGVDIDAVNSAMEMTAIPSYPTIPTAVGFCMYIRRALIDKIGLFDAATFGMGYGEENDFCMRAIAAGYRNVLCDDTFVAHAGGKSFDSKTEDLKIRNSRLLQDKHPEYVSRVMAFIAEDSLAPLRDRVINYLRDAAIHTNPVSTSMRTWADKLKVLFFTR